jgi:protein TonB
MPLPKRAKAAAPSPPTATEGESGNAATANALVGKTEAVFTPKPPYPLAARRQGAEGVVILKVAIASDGRVVDAYVERSSGNALLDESARSTILQRWRFRSRPHASAPDWSVVRVRFDLREA